ncbi:hypothetical protein N7478_008872 [Penicillium angulare]|uniref:uncharacterized protein n=1 Tax=Penicillium angulare TaxID=116970 RepID=UPI002541AE97|nr:uncharacterized protein N7478_008872 [Penicillium angulare]KAJ5273747.1 hypothetical protein N7478_008872 [Penicillium angulare]
MWKSLISNGQQATRTTRHLHLQPSTGLWTPPVSVSTRGTFSTSSQLQKEPGQTNSYSKEREKLNPERSEVTKSGTDSEVAHHPSAYDPHNTSPESELEAAGQEKHAEGKEGNPLNMSPANSDVSAWRRPTEGGPDRNADKTSISGKGSPKKGRSIHVKEDGTHVSYRD